MTPEAQKFSLISGGLETASNQPSKPIEGYIGGALEADEKWLSVKDVSELADCDPSRVRRGFKNLRWRGADLNVRQVEIGRGGASGKALQVHVDSLPQELKAKWYEAHGIDPDAKVKPGEATTKTEAAKLRKLEEKRALAQFKADLLAPVLAAPRHSRERGAAQADILAREHRFPNGKVKTIGKRTLFEWIKRAETDGPAGLLPPRRADVGKARVAITEGWERFFGDRVSQAKKDAIAEDITLYIRGLWGAGSAGSRVIAEQATTYLTELTFDLGVPAFQALPKGEPTDTPSTAATPTQFNVCCVNRRRVEREREFAQIAVKDKDNARYHNKLAPRIRRDYSKMKPREIVVGDVHPVDIMMLRPDGTKVWPKAISWFDPATNELHMTFVLLEPREGVRREHIAMAFEAMVDEWGLPEKLYLDNGSEYKDPDMTEGFLMLSDMLMKSGKCKLFNLESSYEHRDSIPMERDAIIRSLPYNATGKPGIEGVFGNLEKVFFSTIQGWTAGDRMNKRTHQKGKDPIPFPGGAEAFLEQAAQALEWYHKRPQKGRLKGLSPNAALRAHIDEGWGLSQLADANVIPLAFAREETRTPDRGAISYTPKRGDTIHYYADGLLPYTGQKITIYVPAFNPDRIFCFKDGQPIATARPEKTYHPLDPAGAREWGRRNAAMRRIISEKRKHCALLDLQEEMKRHLAHLPEAPEAPVEAVVSVGMIERLAKMDAEERAAEAAEPKPETKRVNQWGNQPNAALASVKFLEDDDV